MLIVHVFMLTPYFPHRFSIKNVQLLDRIYD